MVYEYDDGLKKIINRMVDKFPDSFGHIDTGKILPLISDKPNSRAIAEVRTIPVWLHSIMPYRVVMIAYSELFFTLRKNVKDLVVVHELEHIGEYNEERDTFKLKRHEIEDWMSMVSHLGPGWTQSSKIDINDSSNPDWRQALEEITVGKTKKKKRKKKFR